MRPRHERVDDRPALDAIAHSTVQERIYSRLRDALLTGRLVPGQKIVFRDVAATLSTSMMPVREALRRLEAEHALASASGRSLCVPSLSLEDCRELSMLRIALEGAVAQEAGHRITARELARLGDALVAWEDAVRAADVHRALLHNRDFHWSIHAASRRPLAIKLIEALWLRLGPQLALAIGQDGATGWQRWRTVIRTARFSQPSAGTTDRRCALRPSATSAHPRKSSQRSCDGRRRWPRDRPSPTSMTTRRRNCEDATTNRHWPRREGPCRDRAPGRAPGHGHHAGSSRRQVL